ncbi:MAG: hypothetical protein ACLP9S_13855 [Syntrophales bacterium]
MKNEPDHPTVESLRVNEVKRRRYLQREMEEHKTVPEILIEAAETNARDCRKEIQKLKDILRKCPDAKTESALMQIARNQLAMYQVDIAEMREFYGKQNILS